MNGVVLVLLLFLWAAHVIGFRWVIAIFVAMLLLGCAAQEPSSTDNHHRLPEINCSAKMYNGQYHKFCCEGETCVFTD